MDMRVHVRASVKVITHIPCKMHYEAMFCEYIIWMHDLFDIPATNFACCHISAEQEIVLGF